MLPSPADDNQYSLQPRAGKHAAAQFPVWSPGVRVESRRPKAAPWRPMRVRLSFVFLVFLPVSD